MIRKKDMGIWAFLPLFILVGAYIAVAIGNAILGTRYSLPILAVLMICTAIGLLMGPQKLDDKIDFFCKGAADKGLILTILIFMLAGCFSKVASATGAVDSTVYLVLQFVSPKFLYTGIFLISAFLSLCIGTSVGTCTAMVPIAHGLCLSTGLDINIAFAGVIAGAVFGDNLSMVSDTTIAATKGVGAEMKDKFRMNFKIVLPAAIATAIVFAVIGMKSITGGAIAVGEYNIVKIIPYLYVLVTAISGMNIFAVLASASAVSAIVGFLTNSLTFAGLLVAISEGIMKMATVIIMAIFVKGIMGLIEAYGGIEWLTQKLTQNIKSKKGAQYSIGALSAIFTLAMNSTTMAIITAVPLGKDIGERYGISPKRVACLLDLFSTTAMGFLFWNGLYYIVQNLAGAGDIMGMFSHCYYFIFVMISTVISIQFDIFNDKKEKKQSVAP